MNYAPLVDASTVFICLPTLLLSGLILLSADQKRCWPWQYEAFAMQANDSTELPSSPLRRIFRVLAVESVIFTTALIVAAVLWNYFCHHLSWQMLIAPDRNWWSRIIIPDTINFLISIIFCVPLCVLMQLLLFKSLSSNSLKKIICSSKFVFSISVLFATLLVGLPLIYWASTLHAPFMQNYIARDLFRIGVAFSSIPMSITGITVAFSGYSFGQKDKERNSKLLDNVANSQLCDKSHLELDALCTIALKAERFDLADKISRHLLHRSEHADENR